MCDREPHVGRSHRLQPLSAAAMFLPRLLRMETQRAKSLCRNSGKKRRLVGEMTIEGRPRYAQLLSHRPERQRRDAAFLNRPEGFVKKRPREVAMVVLVGAFSAHELIVRGIC